MFLERRTVSRKTPGDGRLEITKQAALAIEQLGAAIAITLDGDAVHAALSTMPCTCRGGDTPHVHFFLQSERFKSLLPGSTISIDLESTRLLLTSAGER